MGRIKRAVIVMAAVIVAAIPALADPPNNDNRSDARPVTVPSTVDGTTNEATRQGNDPRSECGGGADGTVWYSLDPSRDQPVSIELTARDDLEATLDVFRRDRSALEAVDCDETNRRGRAAATFTAKAGERYLIMVGQQFGSEPGGFTLELFSPEPEAQPPGRRLPAAGGVATVDRTRDLTDAWSKVLRAGTSYVVTLASRAEACPSVAVYEPGIDSFVGASAVDRASCNAHSLFTPERTGRHSLLVRAGSGERGAQRYRLRVRHASLDDTAPGNTLSNYERVQGHVGPQRADVVDLHRFYVNRRSDVTLRFTTFREIGLELRNVRGRLIDTSGGDLRTVLGRGRYYAVVRSGDSGGAYTLQPAVRDVTRSTISINGRREAVISPGQAASVSVAVLPAARGTITTVVQRLDPLEGWQFYRRFVTRTSIGRARHTFVPPRPGRFRARAEYSGSRLSAPSETGFAYVSAREPF
ncbi:MAG: hypothetical protein QOI31_521 [Solirubrobacterales bacterium]|jgi:hypothetical protein|nr:hypothetical protein [Solirubrobacterales bacterium]